MTGTAPTLSVVTRKHSRIGWFTELFDRLARQLRSRQLSVTATAHDYLGFRRDIGLPISARHSQYHTPRAKYFRRY